MAQSYFSLLHSDLIKEFARFAGGYAHHLKNLNLGSKADCVRNITIVDLYDEMFKRCDLKAINSLKPAPEVIVSRLKFMIDGISTLNLPKKKYNKICEWIKAQYDMDSVRKYKSISPNPKLRPNSGLYDYVKLKYFYIDYNGLVREGNYEAIVYLIRMDKKDEEFAHKLINIAHEEADIRLMQTLASEYDFGLLKNETRTMELYINTKLTKDKIEEFLTFLASLHVPYIDSLKRQYLRSCSAWSEVVDHDLFHFVDSECKKGFIREQKFIPIQGCKKCEKVFYILKKVEWLALHRAGMNLYELSIRIRKHLHLHRNSLNKILLDLYPRNQEFWKNFVPHYKSIKFTSTCNDLDQIFEIKPFNYDTFWFAWNNASDSVKDEFIAKGDIKRFIECLGAFIAYLRK